MSTRQNNLPVVGFDNVVYLIKADLLLVVPALPEKPPSVAQYLKRMQKWESARPQRGVGQQSFAAEIKQLLFNKLFLALTFASSITMYFRTFIAVCIEAIVADKMHVIGNADPEKMSGYVMALYGVWATKENLNFRVCFG